MSRRSGRDQYVPVRKQRDQNIIVLWNGWAAMRYSGLPQATGLPEGGSLPARFTKGVTLGDRGRVPANSGGDVGARIAHATVGQTLCVVRIA
jgi:hypothetical protein